MPPSEQYRALADKFGAAASSTKGLMLTALLKIALTDPGNARLAADLAALYGRAQK